MITQRALCVTKVLMLSLVSLLVVSMLPVYAAAQPIQFYAWDFKPEKIEEYAQYYEEHYDEEVEVYITPNIGYLPAMNTRIMGGAIIDAVYNFRWNQLRWYELGWVQSMTGMPGWEELVEDIIEVARPSYLTAQGELVSVPYFMAVFVDMYNEAYLREAGYDGYPQTKEELYQVCKDIKDLGIASHPYVAYWSKDFVDRYFFIYLISEGIEVFDENFDPVFQNNPETEAVMEWWVRMYQDGLTSPTILTDSPTDLVVATQEGLAAIFNLHQYFLQGIREAGAEESENIVLAPWVPGKTGTTLQIGEVIQMGGNAPDPERAWEFIKFYSWKNQDGEYYVPKTWGLEAGLLLPYKGFLEDQEIIDSFNEWTDWDMLMDIVFHKSSVEPVRNASWYPEWRSETADILHKMLLEEISVSEAIEDIAALAIAQKAAM